MFFFYIVRCKDNSLYCGQTNDLERRMSEHNASSSKSAKYTRGRRPVKLVYFENFLTLSLARKREAEVKRFKKIKKEELILSRYQFPS